MLFTKEVFHLECLLLGIKFQPEDAYKSVFFIIEHLMLFLSLLKMKK